MTEIMTSHSFFKNTFGLDSPGIEHFADIKFAVMLITITFKVTCMVKMKLFFMDRFYYNLIILIK